MIQIVMYSRYNVIETGKIQESQCNWLVVNRVAYKNKNGFNVRILVTFV